MNAFSTKFRELVIPDITNMCRVQGLLVALERRTFAEACLEVWRSARIRGASVLPPEIQDDLEEWIQLAILEAEEEFTPSVEERRTIADRVADDISAWEAKWLAV